MDSYIDDSVNLVEALPVTTYEEVLPVTTFNSEDNEVDMYHKIKEILKSQTLKNKLYHKVKLNNNIEFWVPENYFNKTALNIFKSKNINFPKPIYIAKRTLTFTKKIAVCEEKQLKIFECKLCNKIYKKRRSLVQHNRMNHSLEYTFKCTECNKKFKTQKSLNLHNIQKKIQESMPKKTFPCKYCPCTYKRLSDLCIHIHRFHKDTPRFICDICDKKCLSINGLNIHKLYVHNIQYSSKNLPSLIPSVAPLESTDTFSENNIKNIHECKYCSQKYLSYRGLSLHIYNSHRDKLKFICEFCDKKFIDYKALKGHHHMKHPKGKNRSI